MQSEATLLVSMLDVRQPNAEESSREEAINEFTDPWCNIQIQAINVTRISHCVKISVRASRLNSFAAAFSWVLSLFDRRVKHDELRDRLKKNVMVSKRLSFFFNCSTCAFSNNKWVKGVKSKSFKFNIWIGLHLMSTKDEFSIVQSKFMPQKNSESQ